MTVDEKRYASFDVSRENIRFRRGGFFHSTGEKTPAVEVFGTSCREGIATRETNFPACDEQDCQVSAKRKKEAQMRHDEGFSRTIIIRQH